ncbi:hypothetical protein B0T17DRAFT_506411 [Bombardia bombarda]|uniref:Zn(2)-C6 fungal-type domain-containing protein n=1 Tax=Bombardia bombarda TaxID=252184 RepID=A0AA39X9N0_9PEZI|nr:hypothetical protein B0T17DRAFT_506411 [Bombardia bombarda]
MEALLGASRSNPSCGSVEDLQHQLRDIFTTKVTETRADHISVTFELRPTTVFHVPVTETENEALEQASIISPLLGGTQSGATPDPGVNGNPATRRINALDTLLNQPSDDHVLQKSVAKHITSSLGEVDGSNWAVRGVSRGEQGWAFTYICKDSWSAWSRQNAKNPARTVIGEWSNKDASDSINMSRPAFDCRGSLTIAFVKNTRTIEVKYDHTPIHKTVAELVEILVPPPPPPIPGLKLPASARREPKQPVKAPRPPRPPKEPKQPRPPRPPRDANAPKPKSARKRPAEDGAAEGAEGAGGEGSQPKKRRKKKKDTAASNPDGTIIPPEMPGAIPVGQSSERPLYNSSNQQADGLGDSQQNGSISYPEGLVGSSAHNDADARSESQGAGSVNGGVHSQSILDIPPGEARRRRDIAIKLLSEQNIDPQTLSPEQFNIFVNQSPDLQMESLAMLVKYGAERLCIVHPNKGGASSGRSTPQQGQETASPAPAGNVSEAATPSRSEKSRRRKKPNASDADAEAEATDAASGKTPKPTRGACEFCRKQKAKCNKEKPACLQCLAVGASCYYAPAKPRHSRVSKADLEQDEPEPAAPEPVVPELAVQEPEEEPEDLGSLGFRHDSNIHDSLSYRDNTNTHNGADIHNDTDMHHDSDIYSGSGIHPDSGIHHNTGFHEDSGIHNHTSIHEEPHTIPPSELVSPPADRPASTFSQPSGFYQQHASGLSLPRASNNTTPEVARPSIPPPQPEYIPAPVVEAPMHDFTYSTPSQPAPLPVAEQRSVHQERQRQVHQPQQIQQVQQVQQTSSHGRTRSRRSLPTAHSAHTNVSNSNNNAATVRDDAWQTVSDPPPAPAPVSKPSPRQTRTRKPVENPVQNPVPQEYDDLRQTSSWSSTPQPAVQTTSQPAHTSPYQATAHITRAKSRQSNFPQVTQSHTPNPIPIPPTSGRRRQVQGSQSLTDTSGYASNTGVSDSTAIPSYDSYSQYPSTQAKPSSNTRIAYEPYTNTPSSALPNSYSSYDGYNTRSGNSASSTALSNPVPQPATTSYSTSTTAAPSTSQWGVSASGSQSRSTRSYNTNTSTPATRSSYNAASSSTQQSQQPQQSQSQSQRSLQGFNVRPQPSVQTRSAASNAYNQQAQQTQAQPPAQSNQSYSTYSNQQPSSSSSSSSSNNQQQQQQNWYGFTASNNNPPASDYSSTAGSGGGSSGNSGYSTNPASHAHGSSAAAAAAAAAYAQQSQSHHRSMNLSSHTYSSQIDGGDQALYDLLRNNPSG